MSSALPALPAPRYCWALCSVLSLLLAAVTSHTPHRVWGLAAAFGYAGAALAAGRTPRSRGVAPVAVALAGAVLLPLVVLAVADRAQLEVAVVERSARLLLDTGSTYLPDPTGVDDYNPYLPGMSVFGLPAALLGQGPLTDARWYFACAFALAMAAALRIARRPACLPLSLLCACPLTALPLVTGGIDLPVVGLVCLGLALAGRGDGGRAGLVLGVAAALKWTAWPALPVVLALLAVRSGTRPALRCAGGCFAVLGATVAPVALTDPGGLTANAVAFPLGLSDVVSPAASPLPGYLLATCLPGGTLVAVTALVGAAVFMAGSLAVTPPLSTRGAADRLAAGLGLAICLLPATRFGYLLYPFVLFAWLRLAPPAPPTGKAPAHAPHTHRHQ